MGALVIRSWSEMFSATEPRATLGMVGRMADPPDMSLIERARRGDRAAWNVLVGQHGRRVLVVLLARGVRASRAEEIVQETWARLIDKASRGALERLELPGLAIAQAVNLAADDLRAERTRRAWCGSSRGAARAGVC